MTRNLPMLLSSIVSLALFSCAKTGDPTGPTVSKPDDPTRSLRSSATGSATEGAKPPPAVALTLACDKGSHNLLRNLLPGYDHISIRARGPSKAGVLGTLTTEAEEGVACAKATSKSTCEAKLKADLDKTAGWALWRHPEMEQRWEIVVATRGDEVKVIGDVAAANALMLPIDSAQKAAYVLRNSHLAVDCAVAPIAKPDGIELSVVQHGTSCTADTLQKVIRVHADGKTTEVSSKVLHKGDKGCVDGRRTEGLHGSTTDCPASLVDLLSQSAWLEAASVPAFSRLAVELRRFGASKKLISRARRARRDEVRHARKMTAHARRFGGRRVCVQIDAVDARSFFDVVVENAIEGCVRETYGALTSLTQAHTASDPRLRETLKGVARDETQHAELAWDIHRWALPKLTPAQRESVRVAMRLALADLADTTFEPDLDARLVAGYPTKGVADELLGRLSAQIMG